MARLFAGGTDAITLNIGATSYAFGPGTIAALVRKNGSGSNIFIAGSGTVAASSFSLRFNSSNQLDLQINGSGNNGATTYTTATDWLLVAATKASGTVAPRLHSLVLTDLTNTWVHENSGTSSANSTAGATSAHIGSNPSGATNFDGDIAWVVFWNVVLTDAQIESLPWGGLGAMYAPAVPKALWLLDQAATSQKVLDLTGQGANESSLSGTAVSTNSVPIWTPHGEHITVVTKPTPSNTVAPAVTGTTQVGSVLTTDNGTWTNSPSSYSYQWQRDALGNGVYSDIGGATASTYTLVDADDTCHVRCNVSATNASGTGGPAASNAVGPITEPAPTNSVAPVASGTATVAQTVSVTTGTWAHMAGASGVFTYQWQRDVHGSGSYSNIGGATSATYTIQGSDHGKVIRCEVTATNSAG